MRWRSSKGLALAEAIRDGFVKIARQVDGQGGGAPVSIGVSHCEGRSRDVSSLLAQTDRTQYLANEDGRNRVEAASLESYLARAKVPLAAAVAACSAG